MLKRDKVWKWVAAMGIGGIFLWIAGTVIDPDYGWHVRLGEIILSQGIPTADPFSYTMSDYPFVDYEWGTNLIWFWVTNIWGEEALIAIYTGMVMVLPFILLRDWPSRGWWLPALLTWTTCLARFTVRPQVVSWVMLAVLAHWMWNKEAWLKYRWWYPVVMVVWANLHGSFPMGVAVIGLWLGVEMLTAKKIDWLDGVVWLTGAGITLVNPYGIREWTEIFSQMARSGWFAQTVAEWIPGYLRADLGTMLTISILITGVMKFREKIKLSYWLVVVMVGVMALGAQRNWPLFAVIAAPAVGWIWKKVGELTTNQLAKQRWYKFNSLVMILAGIIFLEETYLVVRAGKSFQEDFYPEKAVENLQINGWKGKIFNEYAWGGYLIWKMPGEKFFVDGRMPGFTWKAPKGQSDDAFREYLEIMTGKKEAIGEFRKYDIKTAVLKKASEENGAGFNLENYLLKHRWHIQYEDQTAVVLVE